MTNRFNVVLDFQPCSINQFRCANALCIPKSYHCDGYKDCQDGSDEKSCTVTVCPGNKFLCPKGGPEDKPLCVDRSQLCDGKPDCQDGADEDSQCCKYPFRHSFSVCTASNEL